MRLETIAGGFARAYSDFTMSNLSRPTTVALAPAGKHSLVSKFIVLSVESRGGDALAAEMAREKCPGLPVLEKIFRTKTAVGAMVGTNDPYGFNEAVPLALIVDELRDLLATFARVPFRTQTPEENQAAATGGWVGEGLPAINYKGTLKTTTVDYAKAIVMTVISRELAKHGKATEATMLRILRNLVSRHLATQLFDPTASATAAHPASLTYGANSTTSTGSSSAQIVTDVTGMPAKLQTVCADCRWVMRPQTFYRVASAFGAVGLTVTRDNLIGAPVTLLSGMPREIVFLDSAGILYASDDEMDLSITTEASIEMSDAPTMNGITGGGAAAVSLYQCNLVGLKVEAAMSWGHAFYSIGSPTVPAAATYMTTTY